MAKYKPPVSEGEFERGERGLAKVRVGKAKGKPVAEIVFKESGEKYLFKGTEHVPSTLKSGLWNISLTSDDTEIYSHFPWKGHYKAKVKEFTKGSGNEDAPAPKERTFTIKKGKNAGKDFTVEQFTVLLEITDPDDLEGVTIPYVLPYNFKEVEDNGKQVVGFPSSKGRTKQLIDFCDITGVWDSGPMKYKDNILPDLQKRILRADKEFNIVINDGWIESIFSAFDAEEDDLDWEEKEAKDRKPVEENDLGLPPWDDEE
jgi:hypothetical protein